MEEEVFDQGDGIETAAFDRVEEREIDFQRPRAEFLAIAEDDFAKDDRMAQDLFGVIVGGRHSVDFQEGEQTGMIPVGIQKSPAKVFCLRMAESVFADAMKSAVKRGDAGFGLGEGKLSGIAEAADFTSMGQERFDLFTKKEVRGMLLRLRQCRDEIGDFPGLAQ